MSWTDESQFLKMWYEKTQNPYFVWSAYIFFRKTNRPVPKWVLYYFDNSASNLLEGVKPLDALDFSRTDGNNMLNGFMNSIEHVHIINEYAELIETTSNTKAKEILAMKFGKDMSSIDEILVDAVQPEGKV